MEQSNLHPEVVVSEQQPSIWRRMQVECREILAPCLIILAGFAISFVVAAFFVLWILADCWSGLDKMLSP